MTYCHVAVSTADTSQQGNFTDSHVSLKALFETTELGQRHFKSCTDSNGSPADLLLQIQCLRSQPCTEKPQPALPSTETICGSPQTAADTRPKHQPPFPFPLQENSTLTQSVFKGSIVVWPTHTMPEAGLQVLKVVDKVLHVSSRLQHF